MKKYGNFLRSEAFRRTFCSYLTIALLFSALILGFVCRDLYTTAKENFFREATVVSENIDRKAVELVKAVDQFAARVYANTGTSEDFFRFFGATAEEYTSKRLDLSKMPEANILEDFKALVVRSNFSIRHIICYAPQNVVDLEFNDQGDSRHKIITTEEADRICRSGCVYQKDIHKDSTYLGKIAIVADITKFVEPAVKTAPDRGICLVLANRVIPIGSINITTPQIQRMLESGGFPKRFAEGDLSLYCSYHTSQILPFSVIYMLRTNTILYKLFLQFFLMTLCFILAFGAISAVLVQRFSRDNQYITTILGSMEKAETENFEPLPVPGYIPEYDAIIQGLNELYAHLKSLIEQEYKLTISQQKTEMEMLSVQLSPHFLYNTLERIRMRAVLDNAQDVAEATAGLGLLYRNIVKTEPVISLKRELEITQQYLDLMTFLYGDQFMYYFDVDPALEEMMTPKIWMQPIVENFFKHNFQQDDQIKVIVVELNAIDGGFEGRFFDNIGSLEPERIQEINEELVSGKTGPQGIGLTNILHRLRLFYGSELTITMENNDPAGICIHIVYKKEG